MPASAASPASTMAIPVRSATLSPVPNSAIAVSFAQLGARSMSPLPITANGLALGSTMAATSSARPTATTAALSPAAADRSLSPRVVRVAWLMIRG